MPRFIHKSVRLYTHLTRAYRMFTYSKEISKWLEKDYDVELAENGKFNMEFLLEDINLSTFGSKILDYEKEKYIKILWKDNKYLTEGVILEMNFMSSTSETEYCSEIHILHHGFENFSQDVVDYYNKFWEQLLERIRKKINGSWIIRDEELTLDCLK